MTNEQCPMTERTGPGDGDGGRWWGTMWNVHVGCTPASEACEHCYAMREEDTRFRHLGRCGRDPRPGTGDQGTPYFAGGPVYQGDEMLMRPLRRRKPTTWFVDGRSDLFHEAIPDGEIDRVFAVMTMCPHHTFLVLTKRAGRLLARARDAIAAVRRVRAAVVGLAPTWVGEAVSKGEIGFGWEWPPPNVWMGVTAENQARADERVPELIEVGSRGWQTWLSVEPMLGPIRLGPTGWELDGVVCGGESGKYARPMHPDWARGLRDQCAAAGVPFFFQAVGGVGDARPGLGG